MHIINLPLKAPDPTYHGAPRFPSSWNFQGQQQQQVQQQVQEGEVPEDVDAVLQEALSYIRQEQQAAAQAGAPHPHMLPEPSGVVSDSSQVGLSRLELGFSPPGCCA